MWEKTVGMVRTGRAIMVFSAKNEQRMEFLVHGHHWEPIDFDGITLMLRPAERAPVSTPPRTGWSKAAQRRRASGIPS